MVEMAMGPSVPGAGRSARARDPSGSLASSSSAPNATLTRRIDLTPSVARFWVSPDNTVPRFEPGQYFALGLTLDGRLLQRPYSTASPPGTPSELEFLIRHVPGGALTPRLWQSPQGTRLRIGRPKGLFALVSGEQRTHLFITTGTGLAPVRSMLDVLLANQRERPWLRAVIVHGVSYVSELAYRDRLEQWARTDSRVLYLPVISRPGHPENAGWTGAAGRVDGILDALCEQHGIDPLETVVYLCGNPDAIAAVSRTLQARGFPAGAIVTEHYWTASPSVPRPAVLQPAR